MDNGRDQLVTQLASGRTRRRRLLGAASAAGLLLAMAPMIAAADKDDPGDNKKDKDNHGHRNGHAFSVTGTAQGGATFAGQLRFGPFSLQQGAQGNQVMASGFLSGQFRDAGGQTIATLEEAPFTAPLTNATDPPVTCQILNLTLGPLTLNLLGLVVVIPSPIVINIFAIPGAGNLLGNLLCAVVNLLNGNPLASLLGNLAALQQLISLLNQIVAVLGGL